MGSPEPIRNPEIKHTQVCVFKLIEKNKRKVAFSSNRNDDGQLTVSLMMSLAEPLNLDFNKGRGRAPTLKELGDTNLLFPNFAKPA